MDLEDVQPIQNTPALFIKNKKILVVADLHIGIEKELREHGIHAPSQTKKMTEKLFSLCKKHTPKDIILLGDIKHNIPTSTFQERKDVKNFLEEISGLCNTYIVPGNHDGFIKKLITPEIKIHPSDGFSIENIGFVHGHRWPSEKIMESDLIITAHTHPTIMLKDRLEFKSYEPCWLKSKFISNKLKEKYPNAKSSNVLVVPAFNKLCGGIAVNKDGISGPIGRLIDIKNAEVYLIDGTSLGKIKDI